LDAYEQQAAQMLLAHHSGEPQAFDVIRRHHPRFLDEKVRWLPKTLSVEEIRAAVFDLDDARLTIARTLNALNPPLKLSSTARSPNWSAFSIKTQT
jgi:hypothetical protein